ncbi:putative adhesin [Rahnella aceris]|uniref:putative adhesin n=1 Tax=Rahnella sp. (strain Y9602) TaxID=2703885 RepID=UPI001C27EB39|nr:hypothetical protein [Rahnella aceris]MBU9851973.1 hypothetical protein [Rahnella aceris]
MSVQIYRNIKIKSLGGNARKAMLLSHGGYTPQRSFFQRGSGSIVVPANLTLLFNSAENEPSIGTKAMHLLQGYHQPSFETLKMGAVVKNYSLEYNKIFEGCLPTATFDLITITEKGKAHLSDLFDAIKMNRINYDTVHIFACRINKLTYRF